MNFFQLILLIFILTNIPFASLNRDLKQKIVKNHKDKILPNHISSRVSASQSEINEWWAGVGEMAKRVELINKLYPTYISNKDGTGKANFIKEAEKAKNELVNIVIPKFKKAGVLGKVWLNTFVNSYVNYMEQVQDESSILCHSQSLVAQLIVKWDGNSPSSIRVKCLHEYHCFWIDILTIHTNNTATQKKGPHFVSAKEYSSVSSCQYSFKHDNYPAWYPASRGYEINLKQKKALLHCDLKYKKVYKDSFMEICKANEAICGFKLVNDEYKYHIVCCNRFGLHTNVITKQELDFHFRHYYGDRHLTCPENDLKDGREINDNKEIT